MTQAMTNLYNAESIGREIIQNQDKTDTESFKAQIDSTKTLLDSLKKTSLSGKIPQQLDSINGLLNRKEENLQAFLKVSAKNNSRNYYDRVLKRLEEFNYIFEEDNFNKSVKGLDSVQRKAILGWLRYSKKDNAQRLTQQSADSLVQTMKTVLIRMEREEYRYQQDLEDQEAELLKTDRRLSQQLRELRSEIEQEAINSSIDRVNKSREILRDTFKTISWLGVGSVVVILIFTVLILRDTSRSQRYRDELEDAKKYAETLLKRQEQFMAAITHDLRSPLNTVVGYSNLLGESKLSKTQNHYLGQLKKSSSYILQLVNDLLDYSKLESGKMSSEQLPFNPKSLIEDSIAASFPANPKPKVSIKTDIDDALNTSYKSDPFRIQQILSNLLTNAYKFTERGSININARLDTDNNGRKHFVVAVQDSGIGIEKDKQKHIFDEFSQADSSIEKKFGGTGLGLAITKKIVDLLAGDIRLESVIGKGTTFTVSLPIEDTAETPASAEENAAPQAVEAEEKKLLLVDDDLTQLDLSNSVLSKAGFICQSATSGQEALELTQNSAFDLIITDIQMPEIDGFELVKSLKNAANTQDIPVIALSGRADIEDKDFRRAGFDTRITKPFEPADLIKTAADCLGLQQTDYQIEESPSDSADGQADKLYDLNQLKQFTGNDDDSLKSILESFVESTEVHLEKLEDAIQTKNTDQVAFNAHKILPMLKQIKATNTVQSMQDLERINQNEMDFKTVEATFKRAKPALHELLKHIKQEVKTLSSNA